LYTRPPALAHCALDEPRHPLAVRVHQPPEDDVAAVEVGCSPIFNSE
jgi:hypothetical protein